MLKNIKIGKRLIIAFILVTIIASLSGIMGLVVFIKTDNDYSYALENYGFASGKIGMLNSQINVNRAHIRDVVFLKEQSQRQDASNKIQEAVVIINQLMEEVGATNTSVDAKNLFDTIEAGISDYRTSRDKVMELGLSGRQDEAYNLLMTDAAPKLNKISSDIDALYQMNFTAGQSVSDDLSNFGKIMLTSMVLCILVGVAVAVTFAIFIARGISRPLVEIELGAEKMAEGDYDVHIAYTSNDEVGSLANSMRQMMRTTKEVILDTSRALNEIADGNFNVAPRAEFIGVFDGIKTAMDRIVTDLSETILQIKMSSDQVSSGSDQVSSGAQALAQGATEQASSVEELSAAINEISQQIKENATSSSTASQVVDRVGDSVKTSNRQMAEMMSAMSEISSSSSQISKIIKTIEDIAFQTNILALNAAVEAARAGAAGKGFAVVADEVRNLATKSSDAAKQTNALIESSVSSVDNGVKIADATAKSLAEVVVGAEKVTELIAKISQASGEQAVSISQINMGIEQISSVVQTNSATSEQSAAASEELNGQAGLMKQMVSRFRLKNNIDTGMESLVG